MWSAPAPVAPDRVNGPMIPILPWSWLDLSLDFQTSLARKLPNLLFHYDVRTPRPWVQPRDFPMKNLVSLKLPDPYYDIAGACYWRQVILDSPNLKTLHCYQFHMIKLYFHRGSKENLPGIRELKIESTDANMSPCKAVQWALSNLSVLKLFEVNLESFFTDIPFEKLSGLRELRVRIRDIFPQAEPWVDIYLVPCIEAIVRLEVLEIKCTHPHKLLPALEKHKLSLKVLRLTQCMTRRALRVTAEDIEKMRTLCPYLDELVLDIKVVGDAEVEQQREKT